MHKRLIALFVVAAAVAAAAWFLIGGSIGHSEEKVVVVYAAPTLLPWAEEAVGRSGLKGDIRAMGSVEAVRLIQAGNVPDAFLSVDMELARFIQPRRLISMGFYKLVLACRSGYGLDEIGSAKIGIADPNAAPVGYRSLAALYWLATRYGKLDVESLKRDLSVSYTESGDTVLIDARSFSASGRFIARPNISGVGALLESGSVDCALLHEPFVLSRGYEKRFTISELPVEINFFSNPPVKFVAKLQVGDVDVTRFESFAASFTELGDEYLAAIEKLVASGFQVGGGS